MKITGTFLDEISYDIPHQNWGEKEWDADVRSMASIGIDTVILIRCGLRRYMAFPSEVLKKRMNALEPYCDLTAMFLRLAEKEKPDSRGNDHQRDGNQNNFFYFYHSGAP